MWSEKRFGKNPRETIYSWLDYQAKLTKQDLKSRFLVLYNHSGTNISASTVDRNELPAPFIVDVKLYWASCKSQQEADYLAAILNADSTNAIIKPFQSLGLQGERDIHKKVLDIPFPLFDPSITTHKNIAHLGAKARHWHVDISYINVAGTFFYLCTVLDGYSLHTFLHEPLLCQLDTSRSPWLRCP